ncbi:MAG TPA: cation:proton antiporter [Vicinamibacterales bacterium]|nr:cation:proton antiporter [Vicinamibacterales bacterium]
MGGLAVVLLLVLLVQRVGGDQPLASGSVALAIGFALIAAALVGALVERLALPRVTGYLLFGLVCGPFLLNLITAPMARELRLFNGLAVALIAFIAGLEINFERLLPQLRRTAGLGFITLGVMYAVLFPVIWLAWPWLPLEPDATPLERAAFALVVTVIVISFSPTVTIAVIAENRARGPLTDLTLAVVILADLVLILGFTLAMQLAAWASGTGHSTHEAGLGIQVMWEILGSFAFGSALGAVFALYLRHVAREVTLVLLGLCVVLTGVGGYLEFEPLLAALAAGLVVENIAPPSGDALKIAVERGALPVLVIFFAAAGASLQLDALAKLGAVALGFAVLRGLAMWSGTAAARAWLGDRSPEARAVWLGLVSQAGVTLGLVMIVAEQYPGWGERLQTLVVSLIAIHEVVGPVLFRAALARAGEIGRMDSELTPDRGKNGRRREAEDVNVERSEVLK